MLFYKKNVEIFSHTPTFIIEPKIMWEVGGKKRKKELKKEFLFLELLGGGVRSEATE